MSRRGLWILLAIGFVLILLSLKLGAHNQREADDRVMQQHLSDDEIDTELFYYLCQPKPKSETPLAQFAPEATP